MIKQLLWPGVGTIPSTQMPKLRFNRIACAQPTVHKDIARDLMDKLKLLEEALVPGGHILQHRLSVGMLGTI